MSLLIEESNTDQVSPLLHQIAQNIVSHGKCCDSLQKDLFNVVIIVLLIENGFFAIESSKDVIYDVNLINNDKLKTWKNEMGLLEVNFVLSGFENYPIKLIISPLGSAALVNLIIMDLDSETYSVCLPLSRFVVSPFASTIPMIFRDLKNLSVTFKNKLLTPVKSRILGLFGYPGASLVGLPEEVLRRINLHLPVPDVGRFGQTCRRMKFILDDESLWHDLYKRDFNGTQTERTDWKAMYREKYVAQKEADLVRRGRAAGSMHDYMDYSDYRSYIDNPLWDNMII